MTEISAQAIDAPHVRRLVQIRLAQDGFATLAEFVVPTGRRFDLFGINPAGTIVGVEIKISEADMRGDVKWPDYLEHCHLFYLACGPAVPLKHAWPSAGLITADEHLAHVERPAELREMHGPRVSALTLALARTALARLHTSIKESANG
jgi:hypothetical protein